MPSFFKGREHENIGQNTNKLTKLESDYINYQIANDYMYTHIHSLEKGLMKSLTCINKPTFSSFSTGKGILVQNCRILSPTVNVSLITPWCFADTK